MQVLTHTQYRDVLKEMLGTRVASNPNYSLRAFARDLGISASTLSHVLSLRKGLSTKSATQVAKKMFFGILLF